MVELSCSSFICIWVNFRILKKQNMKRKLIYEILLIVSLTTIWSCDFDTDIYTAIDMDNAFGSAQDIENALNGVYRNVGYYPYRGNRVIAISDMASDISEADASTGHS